MQSQKLKETGFLRATVAGVEEFGKVTEIQIVPHSEHILDVFEARHGEVGLWQLMTKQNCLTFLFGMLKLIEAKESYCFDNENDIITAFYGGEKVKILEIINQINDL